MVVTNARPSTSAKLREVLRVAEGSTPIPATTLKAVAMSIRVLISEVEALEKAAQTPQDAAPSATDDLRKITDEAVAQFNATLEKARTGLAARLRDAARGLDGHE
jgi:ribosome recycling factor